MVPVGVMAPAKCSEKGGEAKEGFCLAKLLAEHREFDFLWKSHCEFAVD